ncbi:unnamed protein product [Ambrosiozyma monospora]|uniref:Unnamed protein product n=1 Tax=Ambrosiozyma monospora TaxID=43982 RepID=A0ACB5T1J0_AMBMO|nr:unnamed protein product [Ambrosiozyma monospora]
MSSNNFSISTILDLPHEIRSLIGGYIANDINVLLSSNAAFSYSTGSALKFESLMHELLSMSNNPILDDLLSDIVQQLVLNETVFESQYFDKLVDYVLSKKIKVRSVKIPERFYVTDEHPKLLDFFKFGTEELAAKFTAETPKKMAHAKFVTSLDCSIRSPSRDSLSAFSNFIKEFPNLTRLHFEIETFPVGYVEGGLVKELCESIESVKLWLTSVKKDCSEGDIQKRRLDKMQRKLVVIISIYVKEFKPELIKQLKNALSGTNDPNITLKFQLIEDQHCENYAEKLNDSKALICGLKSVKEFD